MQTEKIVRCVIILISTLCGVVLHAQNFTNKGKEFWVGYGQNDLFNSSNIQDMVLYLSADQTAHVIISVGGYSKPYTVPANTALATDPIPKDGPDDCRITDEGLYSKNIHIVSDVPIVVFEHTYGQYSSGATMLLPVDVYGYTYYSMNPEQNGTGWYSWFYVVAKEDHTKVRITPSGATKGGHSKNVAFDVDLKRGEIYNVMGKINGSSATELSGSKIQSIVGDDGDCHAIGVFSGTSRTDICGSGFGSSDFMMVQGFPVSAWGKNYLTALTSSSDGANVFQNNRYRIYVSDINTNVYVNGTPPTAAYVNGYYEILSGTADHITADKPIMVAQFMTSQAGCGGAGYMDPEMFYLSPVEQAINKVIFYNTDRQTILFNYLTLIVPESGMSTLRIDGSNLFDYAYPHPNMAGYRIVVKKLSLTPMQHTAESSAPFTGITYGLGDYESYGYNIGAYINNLAALPEIKPDNSNGTYNYVCTKTPFHFSVQTIYKASAITLHFSKLTHITPATDVSIPNPVPSGTAVINGTTYYTYDLSDKYEFSVAGEYALPVSVTAPNIDNCSQSELLSVVIPVHQGPSADFSAQSVCASDSAHFVYIPISPDARLEKWYFGDNTTDVKENPAKKYLKEGTYDVTLQVIRDLDGCLGDTVKSIDIRPSPLVNFSLPDVICMPGGKATFTNKTTISTGKPLSYQWSFGDNGTSVETDPTHTYTATASYTVKLKATADGCTDSLPVTLPVTAFLAAPEAKFTMSDDPICLKKSIDFTDKSTYDNTLKTTWSWKFSDGTTSSETNPSKAFDKPGLAHISLVVNNGGCESNPANGDITVNPLPVVDAGPDVQVSVGDAAPLQGTIDDKSATVKWSPFVYLSGDNILNPIANPPAEQRYYLTATSTIGCTYTDSVLVKVYNDIIVPNIFTPNGDGINDLWDIKGLQDYRQATLNLFNRWGQLVYRIRGGYTKKWDGTGTNGALLPSGIYYYVLQPGANGYGKITGSVTIVR